MYKLVKWAYKLGVKHERRRVKMLVSQYKGEKPNQSDYGDSKNSEENYHRDMNVYYGVGNTLNRLLDPQFDRQIETYKTPLGDEEDLI